MKTLGRWPLVPALVALPVLLTAGVAAGIPLPATECGPGSAPPKAVCECGDTVVGDYVFTADLTCGDDPGESVNGLIVDGVSLDLNGFELSGTLDGMGRKQGTGLTLIGVGGSVGGGRIQNFDTGISAPGATKWTIGGDRPLTVTKNDVGLGLATNETTITNTAATSNLSTGIDITGGDNVIARNTCSRNGGSGLEVVGSDNVLDHNRCERNGGNGISVSGFDNVLSRNLGANNGGTGVLDGGAGTLFESNQGRGNGGDGVRGTGVNLDTNGRNYGASNGGINCLIDGFTPTGGGRYC